MWIKIKTCPGFSADGHGGKSLPLLAVEIFASAGTYGINLARVQTFQWEQQLTFAQRHFGSTILSEALRLMTELSWGFWDWIIQLFKDGNDAKDLSILAPDRLELQVRREYSFIAGISPVNTAASSTAEFAAVRAKSELEVGGDVRHASHSLRGGLFGFFWKIARRSTFC